MYQQREDVGGRQFERLQAGLVLLLLACLLSACAGQTVSEKTPAAGSDGAEEQVVEVNNEPGVVAKASDRIVSARSETSDPDFDEYVARGQSLVLAARFGHKAALLNQGADLEARDEQGNTPIIAAAGERSLDILDLLIEQGADVNAQADDGTSALMLAAAKGYLENIKHLLKAGARLDLRNDDGDAALETAIRFSQPQVVDSLLAAGADVNPYSQETLLTQDLQTPLMLAVRYGASEEDDVRIVQALLARGAEPNLVRPNGDTALTIARRQRATKIVAELQRQGARDESPYALLSHEEALLKAIKRHDLLKAERLLSDATDVNYRNSLSGVTPLLSASFYGQLPMVELLLKYGADYNDVPWGLPEMRIAYANIPNADRPLARTATRGDTALITAIRKRHTAIAEYLIKAGAYPALPNRINDTPGLLAARFGDASVMRQLLAAGLDPDLKRIPAIAGYSIANIVRRERIRPMLIEAAIAGHADVVDVLLDLGHANPDIRSKEGKTALAWAAAEGNLSCVETLLKHDADPDIRDDAQVTPLMHAARSGYLHIVEALVNNHADINAIDGEIQEDRYRALDDRSGNTALILAARGGHLDIVRFLLQQGAMRSLRSATGIDAAEIARRNGHLQVARLIEGEEGS